MLLQAPIHNKLTQMWLRCNPLFISNSIVSLDHTGVEKQSIASGVGVSEGNQSFEQKSVQKNIWCLFFFFFFLTGLKIILLWNNILLWSFLNYITLSWHILLNVTLVSREVFFPILPASCFFFLRCLPARLILIKSDPKKVQYLRSLSQIV